MSASSDADRKLLDIFMEAQAKPEGRTFSENVLAGIKAVIAAQSGPSEREAAIDECRDAAHDAIHHAIERMDLCAFVKGHVDEALLALKNAAPQGGTSSGVERPSNGEVGGSSPQPVPAAAASEAGADDAEEAAYWRHAVATNMIRDGSDGVHLIQGEVSEGRSVATPERQG